MRLPNAHLAVVEERKVAEYLLNQAHPDNGGKAAFFLTLGFSRQSATNLSIALVRLAGEGNVVHQADSPHGQKYVVEGVLDSPAGKNAVVRTVWIVDHGQDAPRLVTAYPGER